MQTTRRELRMGHCDAYLLGHELLIKEGYRYLPACLLLLLVWRIINTLFAVTNGYIFLS